MLHGVSKYGNCDLVQRDFTTKTLYEFLVSSTETTFVLHCDILHVAAVIMLGTCVFLGPAVP